MRTKAEALMRAQRAANAMKSTFAIYQVANGHWMMTGQSRYVTRLMYRKPIKNWEEVPPELIPSVLSTAQAVGGLDVYS